MCGMTSSTKGITQPFPHYANEWMDEWMAYTISLL